MVGLELVAGYLVAWGVRKARRAAGRLDEEADSALDMALDHLHDVVARKLGQDAALTALEQETVVSADERSEHTQTQVRLALEGAAERDPQFGRDVAAAVERVLSLGPAAGDRQAFDLRSAQGVQVNYATGNLQVNRFN